MNNMCMCVVGGVRCVVCGFVASAAVADAIRTSLGPRGMDKMIQKGAGEVLITNDGATILSQMQVYHPTAQMLVQLSKSKDIEAGDGPTSVCVVAGSLLNARSEDRRVGNVCVSTCRLRW